MSVLLAEMQAVASDLQQDQGVSSDIAATGGFLSWLMELAQDFLVPLLTDCFASKTDEEAVAAMNDPNWFQEFILRRGFRKQLDSPRTARRLLEPMMRSFSKVGKGMTVEKWQAIKREA